MNKDTKGRFSLYFNVDVLAKVDDKIVAARQSHILATAFHPELTNDLSFHRYFVAEMR